MNSFESISHLVFHNKKYLKVKDHEEKKPIKEYTTIIPKVY
jgi:hypothetical protein